MLRVYTSDTLCRVCKIDERLINEEKRVCVLVCPDLLHDLRSGHECPGRVIGVAEELCRSPFLWDDRKSACAFDRDGIFPKGMHRYRDAVARAQYCLTEGANQFNRAVSDTDLIGASPFNPRNMLLQCGIPIVRVGRYRYFARIP